MHKAVILRAPEYLISLLLGDEAVRAGLGVVDCIVVEVHAHVILKMAAALAHKAARTAAGARADGDSRRVLDERAYLVVGSGAGVVLNGAHDGHNAHEGHAQLAGIERGGQHLNAAAGVLFKAVAEVGIALTLLLVGKNTLHNAGNPDGVVVAKLTVRCT